MIDIIYLDVDGVLADFNTAAIRAHLRERPLKLPHGTYYQPDDCFHIASPENWPANTSLMKYLGIKTLDEFWEPINKDPLFWRGLRRYAWMGDMVTLCSQHCKHLVLCTSPSNHHYSWAGKSLWLHMQGLSHIPCIMMSPATIGEPKGQTIGKWMFAGPGRVLIDDYEGQLNPFISAGGAGILFPQPWNDNYRLIHSPVDYVQSKLKALS